MYQCECALCVKSNTLFDQYLSYIRSLHILHAIISRLLHILACSAYMYSSSSIVLYTHLVWNACENMSIFIIQYIFGYHIPVDFSDISLAQFLKSSLWIFDESFCPETRRFRIGRCFTELNHYFFNIIKRLANFINTLCSIDKKYFYLTIFIHDCYKAIITLLKLEYSSSRFCSVIRNIIW